MVRSVNTAMRWTFRRRTEHRQLPDVIGVVAHGPHLFVPWLLFMSRLMLNGVLPRRDTELMIFRTAWNCRCRYEWEHHRLLAHASGLDGDSIGAIPVGESAPGPTPRQSPLLLAADQIHLGATITSPTWHRLTDHYSSVQLLEIIMVVGHYQALAGIINSTGLSLDDLPLAPPR